MLFAPDAPMGGLHGDAFSRLYLDPATEAAAAGEDQPVNDVPLDHGNLQHAIKGRRFDAFPSEMATGSAVPFIVAG